MKRTALALTLILALLLSTIVGVHFGTAQNEPTLAESINNVVSNIQDWNTPWTATYGQIFGLTNQSAYDTTTLQALNQNDSLNVIFIARLAELNGYSSKIINDSVVSTLKNMSMVGSLPETSADPYGFLLYDRYMLNAYRYAQELNVSGWNITQAYLDFAKAYLTPPKNSQHGEMFLIDPSSNFSESYSNRYYDEYAETLDMFLMFAESNVNATVSYDGQILSPMNLADDMWLSTQSLWNNNFYDYNLASSEVECETGNFATLVAEYQNYRGNLPYFDRIIQDLEYKLLVRNFSSPAWGTVGVLKHADSNPQLRLEETMGALIALQMLYPYFNQSTQINFKSMLLNGMWLGLISSQLFNNGQFQFNYDASSGFSADASSLGAMLLFLDGIVPDTGYLAINASNEAYQDYRTCFPTSEWNFNYQNQLIRIPVIAGNLTFLFGSGEVNQNFSSNGVYNIQFTSDWNSIISITKIADVNPVTLQPIDLQAITRISPTVTPTPAPTLTPTPTPTLIPVPTSTPTPTLAPTPTIPELTSFILLPAVAIATCSFVLVRVIKPQASKKP